MKIFKEFYLFSTSERRGIVVLLIIILVVQLLYFGVDKFYISKSEIQPFQSPEVLLFQKEIDSLKLVKKQESKPKIFPFNPNFLSDFKAYSLGISTKEYDKLIAYRNQNKYVNSAAEFQKITGVSDSILSVIAPYFKFPEWVNNKKQPFANNFEKNSKNAVVTKTKFQKIDINIASKEQLMEINGIGDKLSDRIISYRTKLQGFTYDDQLYEVWNLDKELVDKVLERFSVQSKPNIVKVDINSIEFKVMMKLPYMDYDLTKKIFNYKNAAGKITNLEVLKKIENFPIDKFDRISLYLKAE